MVLIIIGLLFGGYLLFRNANKIRDRIAEMIPKQNQQIYDEDDLAGAGLGGGISKFGQNADLADWFLLIKLIWIIFTLFKIFRF